MKTSEIRLKSDGELKLELLSLLKTQFVLRMQHTTQQLTKNSELKRVRRDIARVRTILAEKVI